MAEEPELEEHVTKIKYYVYKPTRHRVKIYVFFSMLLLILIILGIMFSVSVMNSMDTLY